MEQGVAGAAWATIIGQGVTMLIALACLLRKRQFKLNISFSNFGMVAGSIIKIRIAPFGLAMFPNISLIIINRFSMSYGGEPAIAAYACISDIICIICLILQGVGDGSQPFISQHYGEKNYEKMAYGFAMFLSVAGCIIMYLIKGSLGILFGASSEVNVEIAKI